MYPVMLDVRGRPCLVVGGGGVALRKVEGLHEDGARVTVVARQPVAALRKLAAAKRIRLETRAYRRGEAASYDLVFAATDRREVNRHVFLDAKKAGRWVNVADDPPLCTFHLPARVQRGALQLAIGSGGGAPFVVRHLRQLLERRLGPEWAEWIEGAARFRKAVRRRGLDTVTREQCYERFFDHTVDAARLIARVPGEAEQRSWISGAPAAPVERGKRLPVRKSEAAQSSPRGLVTLVGGGPGDAGLLTVRGWRRLLSADAIVYDRLAATVLPGHLDERVELHCVGKKAEHHPVPQEEISALLIRLAQQGKRVVRLKGGDPYMFGRGGEEAEALRRAGIPFEVVPGVTSALSAPAYAGIPVTHRGEVVQVTLVTAHEAIKKTGPQVRWDLMAKAPCSTILGYMGVTALPRVVEQLLKGGMDPRTPAAMVERGTTSRQRAVRATLKQLPSKVVRAKLRPPAVFVIGPSVRHARTLDWFGQRPLQGERVAFVSPDPRWSEVLELSGVEVVELALPITSAGRVAIEALPLSGWVFRSADEVDAVEEERAGPGASAAWVAWCLSREAAVRARKRRWWTVETVAPATPAALAAAMVARRTSG